MYRIAPITLAVLLAGWFVATHADRSAGQGAAKGAAPAAGVWDLKGVDDAKTEWIGTIVLSEEKDATLKGHIDWLGSNGSCGREYVTGTYDTKTRAVTITGTKVEFAVRIVRASYRAELSENGAALENGKWSDVDPAIPGTWSAKRIAAK